MAEPVWEFTSTLWRYPGDAGWHFVTLPSDTADDIDAFVGHRGGFGSVPVEASVGGTTWKTSLFPDATSASFVLPVKKAVRRAEGLETDGPVSVRLRYDVARA
jgi:hypothetical protein